MTNLADDWQTVHAPVRNAIDRLRARDAARRMAEFAGEMHRLEMSLVHFDLERLRVNVTHLVEPGLVKWR